MKKAVAYLEQFLDRVEGTSKGKVVLATVYGDVHDIGKNLVKTILSNNGYEVYDLGKQVPVATIIEKAVDVGADAIGLSALLVSTSKQMPYCVQELARRELSFPVVIGGAAINRKFGYRTLFLEDRTPYPGGVFYAPRRLRGARPRASSSPTPPGATAFTGAVVAKAVAHRDVPEPASSWRRPARGRARSGRSSSRRRRRSGARGWSRPAR